MVVVSPDNSEYAHQIDQILPVFQTRLYTDMTDVLCGERGPTSILKSDRAVI